MFAVVGRDRALAGVVGESAHRRTLVQGADGVVAQRAEAHRRDVEQRDVIGLSAFVSADAHTRWPGRVRDRSVRVHERFVAGPVDIAFGAEGVFGVRALGTFVDGGPGVPVEGAAVPVAFDEVLLDLRPDRFQQEPGVSGDGIVAQDRMLPLCQIPCRERAEPQRRGGRRQSRDLLACRITTDHPDNGELPSHRASLNCPVPEPRPGMRRFQERQT